MLQTVGEGAERLLCTPHAQPWPAAWTHGRSWSTMTWRRPRNLAKQGKVFRVIWSRVIRVLSNKKLFFGEGSFQASAASCWLRDIRVLRSTLVPTLDPYPFVTLFQPLFRGRCHFDCAFALVRRASRGPPFGPELGSNFRWAAELERG